MTARFAPACSQALPVKPQGVWARGIEAWARSRDRRNWSCGGGGLRGQRNGGVRDKRRVSEIDLSQPRRETQWVSVVIINRPNFVT